LTLGHSNSQEEEAQLTERELSRGAARRLAIIQHVEEVTGNVAMTCRYFGISRHTFYLWLRRYQQLGPEGLRERSHRPLVCPHATKAEVVGKIIHLRQHYHFGPAKIAMYLKRYHDVTVGDLADSQTSQPEPATCVSALQAPQRALEAVRKATAWPRRSD